MFLFAAIFSISCDEKRVFDQYQSVSNGWHKDSIVSFALPEMDTTKRYDMFLNIRNNDDYPYNNLFVIVSLDQPNGRTTVDTIEYNMADPEGKLLGEGFSDIKESKLFYKNNVTFKKGIHSVRIRHAVRESGKVSGVASLEGVTEVGFRIESTE